MQTTDTPKEPAQAPRRRPLWRRIADWVLGILIGLTLLIVLAVSCLVWFLTPDRLTPLIERYASEYLTADLTLGRAELTFWHTFPRLEVDMQDMHLRSRTFDHLTAAERAKLPACADSLMRFEKLHAGVNVLKLLVGNIELHDIELVRPAANLVVYSSDLTNFDIFPPSDRQEPDTAALRLPDISLNRFVLRGEAPVRYVSLPDSVDARVSIRDISFDEQSGNPVYQLTFDGLTSADVQPLLRFASLPVQANGRIGWKSSEPLRVAVDDFTVAIGPVSTVTSTVIDASTPTMVVEQLDFKLNPLRIKDMEPWLPEEYAAMLRPLQSDMTLQGTFRLTAPYRPTLNPLPVGDLRLSVPACSATYEKLQLEELEAAVSGHLTGSLATSVINLDKLTARGEGVGFELQASATEIGDDPLLQGRFEGQADFARLPRFVLSMVPATVRGRLNGDFDFRLRPSYLDAASFHRLLLSGDATLRGLDITQSEMGVHIFSNLMELTLGTDSKFMNNGATADSLLTASLKVDSMLVELPGMSLTAIDMKLGAGTRNRAASASAVAHKEINPIGTVLSLGKLTFESVEDSMRVRIRDARAHASLRRFEDRSRVPLLSFDLDAARMRYRDPLTRVSFRETSLSATLHPRLRPEMSARLGHIYDSIQSRHPQLRADSIYALARAASRASRAASGTSRRKAALEGTESLDYGLDRETKQWLRWFNFKGRLQAKSARLFTPYFPVRNKLSNIDVAIQPDSLVIHNTRYKMGQSDFLINGTISNLSRALTSKRQTMRINLSLESDTININEIAQAAFDGAAFAEKIASGQNISLGDSDNDEVMQRAVEITAATDTMAPLIIPINIDARIAMHARHVVYSNLVFDHFSGEALMLDGALNLHHLNARTDIGSINLSALYTAPRKEDLQFAFGLDVRDFHLDRFMQLMPSLDTIMPLLRDIRGIVNADVAATTDIAPNMDLVLPSLHAAIKISGDSLVLLDAETFRTVSKWLLFKNKKKNMVDHMEVQMVVQNSMMELFPFIFEIDRYRLGVMGSNDLAMNMNYHVSVLKSPIPFKFGINLKGNPDKLKVRLGRAKYKEGMAVDRIAIVDTTRINLIKQIENVFRRGVQNARVHPLQLQRPEAVSQSEQGDTISAADSLLFIQEGLLPAPPAPPAPVEAPEPRKKKK